MVEQVRQGRRNAVVVFTRNDDEAVGRLDQPRQSLEHFGGLARRVFLVHPVEKRKLVRSWVDQGRIVAACSACLRMNFAARIP